MGRWGGKLGGKWEGEVRGGSIRSWREGGQEEEEEEVRVCVWGGKGQQWVPGDEGEGGQQQEEEVEQGQRSHA